MGTARALVKRVLPPSARQSVIRIRALFQPPPLEEIALHDYAPIADQNPHLRLTLVIPTIDPALTFGGVTTGVDIFLGCARQLGADVRIIVDDFGGNNARRPMIDKAARGWNINPAAIEIAARHKQVPEIAVRRNEIFFTFNWWTTNNTRALVQFQRRYFALPQRPLVYLIQEYEPLFYPFSTTHMYARAAYDSREETWAVCNSSYLDTYLELLGHRFARRFVFEPRLTEALAPFLDGPKPPKSKTILVYGRPMTKRNCFPAVVAGLRHWAVHNPQFADWEVLSAGAAHDPISLGDGRKLIPLGKLSLEDYAGRLLSAGVGLSLMASAHPSYPPLEMAHFGLRTITNSFTCKDMAPAHGNFLSIPDIFPETIANALALACTEVERDPDRGWSRPSNMHEFRLPGPLPVIAELVEALKQLPGPNTPLTASPPPESAASRSSGLRDG
ncbi:hypothetical protein NED98_03710 [Sphingomonas sp. MMSM20]|uniref:rhamnosyltransferase WsaF family glycosyltransferase n=1 Tax=Sphingomonas lycopersici TaxID=2951807 RepID=UPI00223723AF|nr:hypothetical protein [Sphingomonas lycopersici]MCW6529346.1 hypothetical protein [Sphingomonas lycopersici]